MKYKVVSNLVLVPQTTDLSPISELRPMFYLMRTRSPITSCRQDIMDQCVRTVSA